MQDRDKELLARDLWGRLGGLVLVPIYGLSPLALYPEASPTMERHEAEIDFRAGTVRVPAISLSLGDVRRIWEAIVLYGEVA